MDLLNCVKRTILEHDLCRAEKDRILVGVSGGRDSIALLTVLYELDYDIGVAHLNHGLRNDESDADAAFVKEFAQVLQIPCYTKKIDAKAIAKKNKANLQATGREQRYTFFKEIAIKHEYNLIATAHHLDDQIESFLFNFSRGTGIRGLNGIGYSIDGVIRPLLDADLEMIDRFIDAKSLEYREDSSNANLSYKRNYIRNKILPLFREINTNFRHSARQTIRNIKMISDFYRDSMNQATSEFLKYTSNHWLIDREAIYEHAHGALILYEILSDFGFHPDQVNKIYTSREGNGQMFFSEDFELLADRIHWIIRKKLAREALDFTLHLGENLIPGVGRIIIHLSTEEIQDLDTRYTAYMDAEKATGPFLLRNWRPGDYFYPLGMESRKQKLKAYFTNKKLNRFEKEEVLIVCSDGEIAWLIGHRMDDRFKIDQNTKSSLIVKYTPEN